MIEITVKTLDSQNHSFSVPDDATVKQFKEKIHETLPIPVESQRLIYCGRVLQEDRKLSEYDVNGKVVHLVQRAPPQSSPPPSTRGAEGAGASNGTNTRSGNWARRGSARRAALRRLDGGNAMYLGAMAIPADVMDASGISTPPPSQSLSRSRLATARRMIRGAVMLLDMLDGPATADPATPPEEQSGSSESNGEPAAASQEGSEDVPPQPLMEESMSEFSQAATAAVIASAFSAARTSGVPSHMTISRRTRGREEVSLSVDVDSQGNITHVSNGENGESAGGEAGAEGESTPPEPAAGQDEAGPSRTTGARRGRDYHTRTPALADVMEELAQVNLRLQPYLQRYQELVRTDPDFGTDLNEATLANRLYFKVSQVMHFLSHAYHALSDIMCDFTGPPPRNLRCRPVLIQHSAVVQAGIPIGLPIGTALQAQINMMTNRGPSTVPAPGNSLDDHGPDPSAQPEPMETPSEQVLDSLEMDSFVSGVVLEVQAQQMQRPAAQIQIISPRPAAPASTPAAPTTEAQATPSTNSQPNVSMPDLPASFSLSPGNVEFFMEVGPGSITIDSVEATLLPSSNGGGPGSVETGVIGSMPWGSAPPPDFIQNLMQAVAGHMIRGNLAPSAPPAQPATTTSQTQDSTTSSSTSPANAANAPGQNSQARGNTATHPTTSTQTRSTSRPHVHLASPMGSFMGGTFDQFLPCNSHHVRTLRRRGPMNVYQRFEPDNTEADPPASGSQNQPQTARNAATAPTAPPRQNMNIASVIRGLMDTISQHGRRAGVSMAVPSVNFPLGLMTQILEGMERPVAEGSSHTLADFMQSYFTDLGDRSYVEGESLLADLVMLMARNLTLQDVMSLSIGSGAPLDNIRPQLREFVEQRILQGSNPNSPQDVSRGIDRLNSEFRPYLDVVLQARLREDIDVVLTVNKFNQVRFAELIKLVTSDGGAFGGRLIMWFKLYVQEMFTILLHCCNDDIQQLDEITRSSVRQLTSALAPGVQEWTISSSVTHLRTYMACIPVSDIQRFLVYRAPQAVPEPPVVPAAAPVVAIPITPAEEPMEMDSPPPVEPFAPSDRAEEPIPTAPLTAEPWHTAVPGEWVPIITRDVQRQRKQSSQAPFSDAYLSGMPSKRRKVVTSDKPSGNLNQIIQDGVHHAVNTVGVSPPRTASVESVSQLVSTDSAVQGAYRSHVSDTLSDSLANNKDFKSDKFPNSDKFFTKK